MSITQVKKYFKTSPNTKFGKALMPRQTALEDMEKVSEFLISIPRLNYKKSIKTGYIDIDIPKYRLENSRTRLKSHVWCRSNGKEVFPEKQSNWLREQDPELPEIQKIQHELLNEISIKQNKGSATLYKTFLREEQKVPIIINKKGFVVSGNRRLCVFRNLVYNEAPDISKKVMVAYWEDSDSEKENAYENIVDATPQTDENYDWFTLGEWWEYDIRKNIRTKQMIEDETGRSDINQIIKRYKMAVLFQGECKEFFNYDIPEDRLFGMRQVLDTYSTFDNKVQHLGDIDLIENTKKMVAPIMTSTEGTSAHIILSKINATGPDVVYKSLKKINEFDDKGFDKEVSKRSDWKDFGKRVISAEKIARSGKQRIKNAAKGISAIQASSVEIITASRFYEKPKGTQNKNQINKAIIFLFNQINTLFRQLLKKEIITKDDIKSFKSQIK